MKKKRKKFFTRFENFIFKLCILTIILLIVGIVCCETTLAQMNLDIQKIDNETENNRKQLMSLEMKIDEITSLENIKDISEQYSLSYRSENIKTIK